jgi:hypothetical protein
MAANIARNTLGKKEFREQLPAVANLPDRLLDAGNKLK